MVSPVRWATRSPVRLSVLALSSRFDGLVVLIPDGDEPGPFSTRSVESF